MYTYPCIILGVVDGDTIDVELDLGFHIKMKERVRLLDVDTPEVYGKKAVPEGAVATEYTKKWIAERQAKGGKFIYSSKKYNARDKYGRSLGVLSWVNEVITESLNQAIVVSGNIKRV